MTYILGIGPSCPMWRKVFFKIPEQCLLGFYSLCKAGTALGIWWYYILEILRPSYGRILAGDPPTVTYILGIGTSCPVFQLLS